MKSRMLSLPNNLKKDPNLVQLLIIFAISFVAMAVLEPGIFLTKKYMVSMMFLFPEYGILALAMMLAMISGGIDLSIIATANFSAIIAIKFLIRFCPAEGTGFIAALFSGCCPADCNCGGRLLRSTDRILYRKSRHTADAGNARRS